MKLLKGLWLWMIFFLPRTLLSQVSLPAQNQYSAGMEIGRGLKQALELCAIRAGRKLSIRNGFYGDPLIRIAMPAELRRVESTLRNLGMGSLVDQTVLSMNRAAEDAAKSAAPIFIQAIRSISFQDALGILRGPDTAATSYLRKTTSSRLTASFRPVIDSALLHKGATRYWNDLIRTYNRVPFVRKVNPNLLDYVTQKALDGIFFTMGREETRIRKDPAARATDLLKKVFGG